MQLFDRVRAALGGRPPLAEGPDGEPVDPELVAATASLLVAAAYGDEEFVPAERRAIQTSLRSAFGISREEAEALLADAEATAEPAAALDRTAASIGRSFDVTGRQRIMGLVWTVVYADRVVDDAEIQLAREVTRLLGLTPEQSQVARDEAFQWFSTPRSRS